MDYSYLRQYTLFGTAISTAGSQLFSLKALKPLTTDAVILPRSFKTLHAEVPACGWTVEVADDEADGEDAWGGYKAGMGNYRLQAGSWLFLIRSRVLGLFFTATNAMEGRGPSEIAILN